MIKFSPKFESIREAKSDFRNPSCLTNEDCLLNCRLNFITFVSNEYNKSTGSPAYKLPEFLISYPSGRIY